MILRKWIARVSALDHEAMLFDELFRAILEDLMSERLRADGLVEELNQSRSGSLEQ